MSEEIEKLEEAVKYQQEFEKNYPNFWKMRSYYSWKDSCPVFDFIKDDIYFSITYDKNSKKVTNCNISLQNNNSYDEFAHDPVAFLQKRLMNVPVIIETSDKSIINFAQETILKAIKGA